MGTYTSFWMNQLHSCFKRGGAISAQILAASMTLALNAPHATADSEAIAAVKQLDIIGRYEFLIHRVAGATCSAVNIVEPSRARLHAMEAHWEMQVSHSRLRHGDAFLPISPLKQPEITTLLDGLEAHQLAWYRAFNGLLSKQEAPANSLDHLGDLSWDMAAQAHEINAQTGAAYVEAGAISPDLEKTISALNEMRVLSQVILQTFCYAAYTSSAEDSLAELQKASQNLDSLLLAFFEGDETLGLPKPQPVMARQISIVANEYSRLSPVIEGTINEAVASPQYSALVLNQSSKLLNELNNSLYLLGAIQ